MQARNRHHHHHHHHHHHPWYFQGNMQIGGQSQKSSDKQYRTIEHFPTVNQEHLGETFPAKCTTPNVPPRNFTWSDFYISLMNSNASTTPTFYIGYHRLLVARMNCSSHPSPLFFVFTWVKPRRPPAQCELFDRACDPIHLGALESNDPSHERIPGLSGLSRYQSSPCKCPEPSELSSTIRSNKPQVKFLTDRLIEGSLIH